MALWLEALARQLADTTATTGDRVAFLNLQFPHTVRGDLRRLLETDEPDSLVQRMETAWRRVMGSGVADMLPAGKYTRVLVKTDKADSLRGVGRIATQSNLEGRLTQELRLAGLDPIDAVEAASVMKHFINPNLIYSLRETQARHDSIREAVPTTREFSKGERIVDQGVRVTEEQALFLSHLESLIRSRGGGGRAAGNRLARDAQAERTNLGIADGDAQPVQRLAQVGQSRRLGNVGPEQPGQHPASQLYARVQGQVGQQRPCRVAAHPRDRRTVQGDLKRTQQR